MNHGTREDLKFWVVNALKANGGSANVVEVAKHVWANHAKDLEAMGDLFFKWQYDMRWAALVLRKEGVLKAASKADGGSWELSSK